MCPACFANAALAIAGVMSAGGLGVVIAKVKKSKQK
jgi:hypothetical protein